MQKGFFSFIAIFSLLVVILIAQSTFNQSQNDLTKIKDTLIKAEIASKERTLLENGTDKIIKTKLNEQIDLQNFDVLIVQNVINSQLSEYLNNKADVSDIFLKSTGKVSAQYLNESSKVIILKTKEIVYAEYNFSSNETKTNNISKKLGDEITLYFKIPIGYSIKVIR